MKILFVSNLYPPNIVGGYERLCHTVAEATSARGYQVTVLTSCYGHQVSRHPGQVVHQALQLLVGKTVYQGFDGSDARRDAICRANLTALRRIIEETRPDKIFCWNLYGLDQSFLNGMVESGTPVVFMLTDNWLASFFNPRFVDWYFQSEVFPAAGDYYPLGRPMDCGRIHFPCGAIFGAKYMRSFYEQAGLFFANSRVVHNGVEQNIPAGAVFQDRASPLNGEPFKLLFAGRIVRLKGLQTVIEALPLLNIPGAAGTRVTLTVVGDDLDAPYMLEMRQLIDRLGVRADVAFLPPVPADRLFDLFQAYDAYVFPSLYEPFSLTLIHALAAGIPTVASNVGGNVEIVHDNETGLLFDRNDAAGLARAVSKLVEQPALRQALSAKARVLAAGFTFDRMVDEMLAFLAD